MSKTSTSKDTKPTRVYKKGLTYVEDSELYHLSSLVHGGFSEVERIASEINRELSNAHLRSEDASEDIDRKNIHDRLVELMRCQIIALRYQRQLHDLVCPDAWCSPDEHHQDYRNSDESMPF